VIPDPAQEKNGHAPPGEGEADRYDASVFGARLWSSRAAHSFWSWYTAPRATDLVEARDQFMVRAITAITVITLVPFTVVFLAFAVLGVFSLLNVLMVLATDAAAGAALMVGRGRAWRLSGWILCLIFLGLAFVLTLRMGGWSPAVVYVALFVALGITLLGERWQWAVVPLAMAAYACGTAARGDLPLMEILGLLLAVAAPICGIMLLMWFSSRQMKATLTRSQAVTAGLEREVAGRKRMEAAVRELMERNRALFESIPDGVGVVLKDGRFVDCNGATVRMLDAGSREEVLGHDIFDVIAPEQRERARAWLAQAQTPGLLRRLVRVTVRSLAGRVFEAQIFSDLLLDEGGAPVGLVMAVRDITDQLTLEAQLRQAQKMEAVGQLAGGVAHDFNNILLGIQGYAELARDAAADPAAVREHLEEVLAASERGGALVRQLLAFSRREALVPVVMDLNAVIRGLVRLVGRLIGEHISLRVDLGPDLPGVTADPRQIEQAIVNLCVNSRDAMPDGGMITIRTDHAALDAAFAASNPWAAPGSYVRVSLADEGTGMSPEVMDHLFEPFFTTKRPDRGTGIGLATVYGIVKQHGGLIHCESAPGAGTRFFIFFPVSSEEVPAPAPAQPAPQPAGGRETLLVAEDDPMVRGLVARILGRAGYTVLTAADGAEALVVFAERGAEVALALVDVVMPGMNGQTLARALRERRPGLPVLFSSGYDFRLLDESLEAGEKLTIVHKPYHPQELLRVVRQALDAAASAG
jgi:two-component system, cell cycle sensor histidine kinase and response regulator CckA